MHEIDFTTGLPAVAYTGKVPWHGFGQPMEEDMTPDEWRVAAGLDWEVRPRRVMYNPGPEFQMSEYESRKILIRSDNHQPLSCVSDKFKIVQPKEILDFFDSLIRDNDLKMNTAGSLRGGKRVWALAELGKDFSIGADTVIGYLLLATAYDGTFSTTAKFTSIRVVCNNTLEFSLNRAGEYHGAPSIKIPHNQEFNSIDVKAQLGLDESWRRFRDNVLQLSDLKVTKQEAIEYFLTVCGVTEEEAADGKQLSNVKKLLSYYEQGPGAQLHSSKDTAWGMVNAVTYLADHGRRSKDNGTRFDSASFGSGAAMKDRAYKNAVAMIEEHAA